MSDFRIGRLVDVCYRRHEQHSEDILRALGDEVPLPVVLWLPRRHIIHYCYWEFIYRRDAESAEGDYQHFTQRFQSPAISQRADCQQYTALSVSLRLKFIS